MTIKLTPTYHRDTYPAISPTNPSLRQAGKTILITGGGGSIGFEIARSFAIAAASRVIIVGRRAGFLDEAVANLGDEFHNRTEFIAHQTDIASDTSVASLWEFLDSQNILVDVLVLNAACIQSFALDTLSVPKVELMESFDTNVGGNFLMAVNFTKQALRPAGLRLYLVNVSTSSIHTPIPSLTSYSTSKAAFTMLLGRIANERSVEDLQIVSFHPGVLYSESAAKAVGPDAFDWDECMAVCSYCRNY